MIIRVRCVTRKGKKKKKAWKIILVLIQTEYGIKKIVIYIVIYILLYKYSISHHTIALWMKRRQDQLKNKCGSRQNKHMRPTPHREARSSIWALISSLPEIHAGICRDASAKQRSEGIAKALRQITVFCQALVLLHTPEGFYHLNCHRR